MSLLGEKSPSLLEKFIYSHIPFLNKPLALNSLCSLWFLNRERFEYNMLLYDDYSQTYLRYGEFCDEILIMAGALQKLGLRAQEKVAQFSENCARWMVLDQSLLLCKAVNAVRGSNAPLSELKYIYEHSDSCALIVDSLELLDKLKSFIEEKSPRFVIYIGNDALPHENIGTSKIYSYNDLRDIGKSSKYWRQTFSSDDPATIVYSSGTTGNPKGILLSHGNLISQVKNIHPALKMKNKLCALNVLPIWHMYERTCEYYIMSRGCTLYYTNIRNFKKDIRKYRPNYLISVPRVWEAIYEGIWAEIKKKPLYARILFRFLIFVSGKSKKAKRILKQQSIYHQQITLYLWAVSFAKTYFLLPIDKFASRTVYKKIRDALGGRFVKGVSGGGALAHHIEDFFEAIGIALYVGYGLTETAPVLSVRREKMNKIYSVGPPLENTEFMIVNPNTFEPLKRGEKGLVLAKGPGVMLGYYKDEEATKKVFHNDWFITGDLGWLTNDNNLVLTGREKDIIVLSNGENIEPEGLEQVCTSLQEVSQIVLAGQDKANLSALVVLNNEEAANSAKQLKLNPRSIYTDKKFKNYILNELNAKIRERQAFRPFERINDLRYIKEPFTIENGLMTQTAKLRKNLICKKYAKVIEEMY